MGFQSGNLEELAGCGSKSADRLSPIKTIRLMPSAFEAIADKEDLPEDLRVLMGDQEKNQ
jgi:hypothetical protein